MQESINSDVNENSTMLASQAFNFILEQVQTSCLNFQMQISPFSAVISIKKSFIKDKLGNMLLPPPPDSSENFLRDKNIQLEKDVTDLTKKYEAAVNDCENAKQVMKSLEKKTLEANLKAEETRIEKEKLFHKEIELEELKNANIVLEEKITSLLDVLYGCEECGRHGDHCECKLDEPDESNEGKDDILMPDPNCLTHPPLSPSETSLSPRQSPATSTPAPVLSSSPTTTPPGTPPLLRRKCKTMLGTMPVYCSEK